MPHAHTQSIIKNQLAAHQTGTPISVNFIILFSKPVLCCLRCEATEATSARSCNASLPGISRSRSTKSVTILNADVSNFRALVQQLTGRPSAPARLRAQRGPLNINFRQAKQVSLADHVNTTPELLPFGYNKYQQQQQQFEPKKEEKQQVVLEHEQGVMSSSSAQSKGFIQEFCNDTKMNYLDEFDEVGVEQCLQELEWLP